MFLPFNKIYGGWKDFKTSLVLDIRGFPQKGKFLSCADITNPDDLEALQLLAKSYSPGHPDCCIVVIGSQIPLILEMGLNEIIPFGFQRRYYRPTSRWFKVYDTTRSVPNETRKGLYERAIYMYSYLKGIPLNEKRDLGLRNDAISMEA